MRSTAAKQRSTKPVADPVRFDARPPRDSSKEISKISRLDTTGRNQKPHSRYEEDAYVQPANTRETATNFFIKRTSNRHKDDQYEDHQVKRKPIIKAILIYKNHDEESEEKKRDFRNDAQDYEDEEDIGFLLKKKSRKTQSPPSPPKVWKAKKHHHRSEHGQHDKHAAKLKPYEEERQDEDGYWFHKDDTGRLRNRATFGNARKETEENQDGENSDLHSNRGSDASYDPEPSADPQQSKRKSKPTKNRTPTNKRSFGHPEKQVKLKINNPKEKPKKHGASHEEDSVPQYKEEKDPDNFKKSSPIKANPAKGNPGKKKEENLFQIGTKISRPGMKDEDFNLMGDDNDDLDGMASEEEVGYSGAAFSPARDLTEGEQILPSKSKLSKYRQEKDSTTRSQQVPPTTQLFDRWVDNEDVFKGSLPSKKKDSFNNVPDQDSRPTPKEKPANKQKQEQSKEFQFGRASRDHKSGEIRAPADEQPEKSDHGGRGAATMDKIKPPSKKEPSSSLNQVAFQGYSKTAKESPLEQGRQRRAENRPAIVPKALGKRKASDAPRSSNSDNEFIRMQKADHSDGEVPDPHAKINLLPTESDHPDIDQGSDEGDDYIANDLSQDGRSLADDNRSERIDAGSHVSRPSGISKAALDKKDAAQRQRERIASIETAEQLRKSNRQLVAVPDDKSADDDRPLSKTKKEARAPQADAKSTDKPGLRQGQQGHPVVPPKEKSMTRNYTDTHLHPPEKPAKVLKKVETEKSFPASGSHSVSKAPIEQTKPVPKFNEPTRKPGKSTIPEDRMEFKPLPHMNKPEIDDNLRRSLRPDEIEDEDQVDPLRSMLSPHFTVPIDPKKTGLNERSGNPLEYDSEGQEGSSGEELDLRDELPAQRPKAPSVGGTLYRKRMEYRGGPIEEVQNDHTGHNTANKQTPRNSHDVTKRKGGSPRVDEDAISAPDFNKRPKVELNPMMKRPHERYSVGPELMRQGSSTSKNS
jgi:hypothetical protein